MTRKTILIAASLLTFCNAAKADAWDWQYLHKRGDGQSGLEAQFVPAPSTPAFLGYNPYVNQALFYRIGGGLTITCGGDPVECVISVAAGGAPAWADITGKPYTFAPSAHTHLVADISDSTATGRQLVTAASSAAARSAIGAGTSSFDGAYTSLTAVPATFAPASHNQPWSTITSTPATLAGYGITDAITGAAVSAGYYPLGSNPAGYLTGITSAQVNAALGFTPYSASNPSAFVNQAGARGAISVAGTGGVSYNNSTGVLTINAVAASTTAITGTTAKTGSFRVYQSGTVTTAGTMVYQLTADGTSTGTALFANETFTDSVQPIVSDATASYQFAWTFTNSNKTLTVTVNKLTTANILTGVLGQSGAPVGTVVKLMVEGR